MTTKSVLTAGTTATLVISDISTAVMRGISGLKCETGRGIRFRWGLLLTMAIFIMQCPLTLSLIVSRPMTAVVMIGGRVRMGCSRDLSSNAVDWEFAPAETNDTSFIYTDRQIVTNLTSRYEIDTDNKTRYDIVIDFVDSSHAGTYICTPVTPGESTRQSGSAQLVVLESDPVCNTNASDSKDGLVEGDYIRLWCAVNYTGNWLPVMDWNTTIVGQSSIYISETTKATSLLTIPLDSGDDGVTIACKTSFNSRNIKLVRNPRKGEFVADNVPDYQYLWTFTPVVQYGPKKITIAPQKRANAIFVGDRFVCWANGNPSPTYEWMDLETNRTISGSVLTIEDQMKSDYLHDFICTASNTVAGIRSQITETVSFKVTDGASLKAGSTLLITILAMGLAAVLSMTT